MPKKSTATHHCKCSPEQDAALRRAAHLAGIDISAFIRQAIAERCNAYGVNYNTSDLEPRQRRQVKTS